MSDNSSSGDFGSLFPEEPADLKHIVGDNEVLLRQAMGNEHFDAMIQHQRAANAISLATDEAVATRLRAVANAYDTASLALLAASALAVAWSVVGWVSWARR